MAVPQRQIEPFRWDAIPEAPEKAPFVLLVEATQGQGKTHLAYTFPQPIFHLDTENRGDKVAAKFKARGSQAYWKVCTSYNDIRRTLVDGVFPQFKSGTVVIDSGSDLQNWAEAEWLQEAKKDKVYPLVLWAKVFEKIDRLIGAVRDRGFYMVITARLKPEYQNDQKTGALVMEGYKRLPYLADMHLRLESGRATVLKNGFRNSAVDRTEPLEAPTFDTLVQDLIAAEAARPMEWTSAPAAVPAPASPKGFSATDTLADMQRTNELFAQITRQSRLLPESDGEGVPGADAGGDAPPPQDDDALFPPSDEPVSATAAQVAALNKAWDALGVDKSRRDEFLCLARSWGKWEAAIQKLEARVAEKQATEQRGGLMQEILEGAQRKKISPLGIAKVLFGEVKDLRDLKDRQLAELWQKVQEA